MSTKRFDVEAYLAGKVALADNFNAGFRRDLYLARERVRRQRRHVSRAVPKEQRT